MSTGFSQVRKTMTSGLDPLSLFVRSEKSVSVQQVSSKEPEKTANKQRSSNESNQVVPKDDEMTVMEAKSIKTPALSSRKNAANVDFSGIPSAQQMNTVGSSEAKPLDIFLAEALPADSLTIDSFFLLSGEEISMRLQECIMHIGGGRTMRGVLFMTNFRLRFSPPPLHLSAAAALNPSLYSLLNIPLASIDKIEKEKKNKDLPDLGPTIVLHCKDMRVVRLTVVSQSNDDSDIDRAIATITSFSFSNSFRFLFAFAHELRYSTHGQALFKPFDMETEYQRQGVIFNIPVGECPWRVTHANSKYNLCATYPKALVVPKSLSDDDLLAAAAFRSNSRIPALCWGEREFGTSLWRSSQPKVGISGSSVHDERFLELIFLASMTRRKPANLADVASPCLHIIDCRSMTNAIANKATGAGYESQANYPSSRLEFYNIPNIHAVSEAYRGIGSIVLNQSSSDPYFTKQIEDTQWLSYIRLILKAGWEAASAVWRGTSVLIHCSDGWDRTAQVACIAQLFLDPFYRTLDGFRVLVEKEWLAFGHPFNLRCAHSQDRGFRVEDQISPIFIQFLDCVWQICKQNSHYFEFNARYILAIADNIYSCRFGTFLFNCDQEKAGVSKSTACLWTYLALNKDVFTNPLYIDPQRVDPSITYISSVFLPPLSQLMRGVTFWADYFLRWSIPPSLVQAPIHLCKYLFDENGMQISSVGGAPRLKARASSASHTRFTNDCAVLASVGSDDVWESAYRRERAEVDRMRGLRRHAPSLSARREELSLKNASSKKIRDGQASTQLTTSVSGLSEDILEQLLESREEADRQSRIVARLVQLLYDSGVADEDLARAFESAEAGGSGEAGDAHYPEEIDARGIDVLDRVHGYPSSLPQPPPTIGGDDVYL